MPVTWTNLKGETQTLSESAERLYNQLAPTYFKEDAKYGMAGAKYVAALAKMLDPTATVVQPTGTKPGFAILFDPTNVEAKWLLWLGQFVGLTSTKLESAPDTATKRAWIKFSEGPTGTFASPLTWTRGTEEAIKLAAQSTLTGAKTVLLYPRLEEKPFTLKAITVTTQTPNKQATKEAMEAIMPAWIVLVYETAPGGSYGTIEKAHTKYSESEAAHVKYSDAETEPEK